MVVDINNVIKKLNLMAKVGGTLDGGISRLALSEADKQARDLLISWMKELDLLVSIDDVGNIYGRMEGKNPDANPLVLGSHLDSLENSGIYDGILGILIPLEIIRVFKEKSLIPEKPIIVGNFTNEEGFRFKPLMSGSGVLSGDFDIESVYKERDSDGKSFKEELEKIGYLGARENRLDKAEAFIELHQEQGPILDLKKTPIGVVEGILGLTWLTVTLEGRTDNSGPTPMYARQDTLTTAAKMITFAEEFASEISEHGIITVGQIINEPNNINAVPGLTKLTLDIREINDELRIDAVKELKEKLREIAVDSKVKISFEIDWELNSTIFSSELNEAVRNAVDYYEYPSKEMVSGAGHISTYMNNICPTTMIFVPSINGISHSPAEKTEWEDIEKSAEVLIYVVKKIAKAESKVTF